MSLSVGSIVEFIVGVVIVKGIIAHWCIDRINKLLHYWFGSTERKSAIWAHYHDQALDKGHAHKSVVGCPDGKCTQFA